MAAPQSNLIYGTLSKFNLGINSGVAVEDLPPNQCGFSNNVTFRGNYATDRPPYRKLTLAVDIDTLLQEAFAQGVFQSASSYKPDNDVEVLIGNIAGRLFRISPNILGKAIGSEITIAGDPNPAGVLQSWMWQSERWLIIQDGISIPIFYDGISSRRSETDSKVIGVTNANFVVPAVGSTVNIALVANYTGLVNVAIYIGDATYIVTAVNGSSGLNKIVLKNITNSGTGTTIDSGLNLVSQPSVLGYSIGGGATGFSGGFFHGTTVYPKAVPSYVVIGTGLQSASSGIWYVQAISADRKTLTMKSATNTNLGGSGTEQIFIVGNNQPNVNVAANVASFVVPAKDSTVEVQIAQAYTNANGISVFIGNAEFEVVSSSSVVTPDPSITVQNVNDIPTNTVNSGTSLYSIPELPTGRMGTYGMGRNWMSLIDGISYIGGDIVGGSSGSAFYEYRDSVLKVTENSFLAGGGAFRVPSSGETITAMSFTATLDTSLGQGALQVFTNKNAFSCNAPVDRATWQSTTNPIQTESLKGAGASSQSAATNSNADLLFRCPDGTLRSYVKARLDFNQWGNTPIGIEVERIVLSENDDLMNYASAIVFDNRWLMTSNPVQGDRGVYWEGLIALNFDPLSSLQGKEQSIYDGLWTGLNILQLVKFQSVDRAFAFCVNTVTNKLEIWELLPTGDDHFDNGNIPIQWSIETPPLLKGYTEKNPATMLKIENGDILVSDIIGRVDFIVQYRADYDSCWHDWKSWNVCSKQSGANPRPQYRKPMSFGRPPEDGSCNVNTEMMPTLGDFFQLRIVVQGHCKIKRIRIAASAQPRPDFFAPLCETEECGDTTCEVENQAIQEYLNQYSLNRNITVNAAYETVINGKTYVIPIGAIVVPTNPDSPFNFPITFNGCQSVITGTSAQEVANQAAAQQAQCDAAASPSPIPPPPEFLNAHVSVASECTSDFPLTISVALPAGISQSGNNLVCAGGVFSSSVSQADADSKASDFLDSLMARLFSDGDAVCSASIPVSTNGQFMVYHPGTDTLWCPDSANSNILIISIASKSVIHTISMAAYAPKQMADAVYDSFNNQIIIYADSGAGGTLFFFNPATYTIIGTMATIANSGSNISRYINCDPTRGYFCFIVVLGARSIYLINGATRTVITTDVHGATLTDTVPYYCSGVDKYIWCKIPADTVLNLSPTGLANTTNPASANLAALGISNSINNMCWDSVNGRMWVLTAVGTAIFNPSTGNIIANFASGDYINDCRFYVFGPDNQIIYVVNTGGKIIAFDAVTFAVLSDDATSGFGAIAYDTLRKVVWGGVGAGTINSYS